AGGGDRRGSGGTGGSGGSDVASRTGCRCGGSTSRGPPPDPRLRSAGPHRPLNPPGSFELDGAPEAVIPWLNLSPTDWRSDLMERTRNWCAAMLAVFVLAACGPGQVVVHAEVDLVD